MEPRPLVKGICRPGLTEDEDGVSMEDLGEPKLIVSGPPLYGLPTPLPTNDEEEPTEDSIKSRNIQMLGLFERKLYTGSDG
jgi:hypothetical protein